MNKLIGITGLAGSGKSTAAELLRRSSVMRVVSFASPLKEMAATLLMAGFCYDRASADWYLDNKEAVIPELGVTMRHLLQTLGTEWGINKIAYDMWVQSAASRVADAFGDGVDVVVDDVRFEHEAAFIRGNGGLLIHLVRPGVVRGGHASEAGVDVGARDVVIENSGSRFDLDIALDAAVRRFYAQDDELLRLCLTPCAEYRV